MLSPKCFTGSMKQLAAVGYFSNCLPPELALLLPLWIRR